MEFAYNSQNAQFGLDVRLIIYLVFSIMPKSLFFMQSYSSRVTPRTKNVVNLAKKCLLFFMVGTFCATCAATGHPC